MSLILLLGAASSAHAGSSLGGIITAVSSNVGTAVAITHNGTRAGAPACVTDPTRWTIDPSTLNSHATVTLAMSAFEAGHLVDVFGTGTCLASEPGMESIGYIVVHK